MTGILSQTKSNVLVLHAGAIGDAVLGTVVPVEIKRARPEAKIIYWTHESLFDLLSLCPAIDEFVPWQKKLPLMKQRGIVRGADTDLLVDLSSSLRTRIIGAASGVKTLRYRKQNPKVRPIMHAAENFRETVEPVVGSGKPVFPTLVVPEDERAKLRTEFGVRAGRSAVALVPGVGALRPHRAWLPQRWAELARKFAAEGKQVILIGGKDDEAVAAQVVGEAGAAGLTNLVGKLTLRQTATALSMCSLAVSGDTGPSHIAVAVGTPCVGLLGPTYPERSGPYGYLENSLNAGHHCRCHAAKSCVVTGVDGPGQCMSEIAVEDVYARATPFCVENSWQ
jgi:heptosyltransferase-1